MLCDFKKSTEKVGLRIHPEKTKILSNQSCLSSDTKKEMQVDDIKIEILTRGESTIYLDQMITFRQQETTESKNRIRAAWAQVQTRTDIEKLQAQTSSPAVRRSNNSDDMLRIWNMGTHQRARKQSTQRKMLHLIIQTKRRYKKNVGHKIKTSEEKETNDTSSTGDESEDGQSSSTHKDQDSDVSFESDNVDAAEVEEEERVDYIKRRTNDAMEKMENENTVGAKN